MMNGNPYPLPETWTESSIGEVTVKENKFLCQTLVVKVVERNGTNDAFFRHLDSKLCSEGVTCGISCCRPDTRDSYVIRAV